MKRSVLGVVPARAGSKGIPGKNLRLLQGRSLLSYVAEAAREAGVERLVLSTDSPEIAELGREVGLEVPFIRPSHLATDEAPMVPVLQHAVASSEQDGMRADIVVLLQPTSPLRRASHITAAIDLLESTGADSVASVIEIPRHYSPEYAMKIENGRLINFLPTGRDLVRRQDAAPAYSRDGTVYAVWRDVLMEQGSIYGEDCRPLLLDARESVNLDTEEDWLLAEAHLAACGRTLGDTR